MIELALDVSVASDRAIFLLGSWQIHRLVRPDSNFGHIPIHQLHGRTLWSDVSRGFRLYRRRPVITTAASLQRREFVGHLLQTIVCFSHYLDHGTHRVILGDGRWHKRNQRQLVGFLFLRRLYTCE
jgi:hypothetical protein